MIQINMSMKQKQTRRYRRQTCDCLGGGGEREGWIGSLGLDIEWINKALDIEWINNMVLLCSTETIFSILW